MAAASIGLAIRQRGPVVGSHHLRPAPIELPVVALAHAPVAGPAVEAVVEALVPEAHLGIERHAAGHDALAGAGAFLPIVPVVLLEGAGRAEAYDSGHADRFLDMRRRRLVGIDAGTDSGFAEHARQPDPERARGPPQHQDL